MSAPADQRTPALVSQARLQRDPLTGDCLLLYPEGILILNPSAHRILSLCDGSCTLSRLVETLATEFNAPHALLLADVDELLQQLAARQLLRP